MRLVFDIECNGLDPDTIWCVVAQDLNTDMMYTFSDHGNYHGTIEDGINLLSTASLLIAHNGIGFDARIIDALYDTNLLDKPIHDTFIMSQVLNFYRGHRHGLAAWGKKLGNYKQDFTDFSHFSHEMVVYCQQDVRVNKDIYNALTEEFNVLHERNAKIKTGLQAEHSAAVFNAKARTRGWHFKANEASSTIATMVSRMEEIKTVIEPLLGTKTVYIDKEPKTPKFKKNGEYNGTTCRILSEYLGHPVAPTDIHLMAPGTEFQRTREEPIEIGSIELLKEWMLSNGWKPDDYQKKKVNGIWITMGPKLTETSLNAWKPYGPLISEYYTLRSRKAIIEGWLEKLEKGRLHGNMWICGTPTFRCRHETIVNLPAVNAEWGKQIRGLLSADPGTVLVGADSSGNQLRGLCHYVGNSDFTNEVIYGDQHQRNADALGCSRATAKAYLYSYLFGAGDAKLGQVLTGKMNAVVGKKSREDFAKSIKGLEELKQKLTRIHKHTSYNGLAWIPGLDGRRIYTNSEHQCLNYLLQSAESITCKAAILWIETELKRQKINAEPRLFYHDELCYQCSPEDAQKVGEILKRGFYEGPKMFDIECMAGGDPSIGETYAEVH